jgi:hypothetical protein
MNIINRIILLEIRIRQILAINKLKKNNIINQETVYYQNEDTEEKVYLDKDLKPHFIYTNKKILFKNDLSVPLLMGLLQKKELSEEDIRLIREQLTNITKNDIVIVPLAKKIQLWIYSFLTINTPFILIIEIFNLNRLIYILPLFITICIILGSLLNINIKIERAKK